MTQINELLAKADFSKETTLKERLRQQLFAVRKPGRVMLSDDDAAMVNAAGVTDRIPCSEEEMPAR